MTVERSEGDQNALLALHFGEGEARTLAATRAHVALCPRCQEYLRVLSDVDAALREWPGHPPTPLLLGLCDVLQAQVAGLRPPGAA